MNSKIKLRYLVVFLTLIIVSLISLFSLIFNKCMTQLGIDILSGILTGCCTSIIIEISNFLYDKTYRDTQRKSICDYLNYQLYLLYNKTKNLYKFLNNGNENTDFKMIKKKISDYSYQHNEDSRIENFKKEITKNIDIIKNYFDNKILNCNLLEIWNENQIHNLYIMRELCNTITDLNIPSCEVGFFESLENFFSMSRNIDTLKYFDKRQKTENVKIVNGDNK